uniref:Uncharacterized protein n=1 Tax=Anguilla anguilla TaxID=7936 RepID=A0A0E9XAM6_ANGAN
MLCQGCVKDGGTLAEVPHCVGKYRGATCRCVPPQKNRSCFWDDPRRRQGATRSQ